MKQLFLPVDSIRYDFSFLESLPLDEKVQALNDLRAELHKYSPFKDEPVDLVRWVQNSEVQANDYNPNTVAPPEMLLLEKSIVEDGYTQPVVTWQNEEILEVVDGFHRNRVGRECKQVKDRVKGYLPCVTINSGRTDRSDRIASTIRHNRARGKHRVDSMSDIVVELKRRNWSNERICRELGMEQDEVLRLCQVTGLAELFTDQHYLTNKAMNRIAWLGQAAACYALGIPSTFRGGFSLLTESEQAEANGVALVYLNKWLVANGRKEVTMDEAYSGERQSDIY